MRRLEEVGDDDGWRCWLCDQPVDPAMSVNDARGPSVDTCVTKAKSKAKAKAGSPPVERLAHRGCNTGKGATSPVVPWGDGLFLGDPAPILPAVIRLEGKPGREAMARCSTQEDADAAATWLVDRVGRLRPGLPVEVDVEAGGGQYLLVLRR